ncbi:hypothetical protein [Litoribrevibacter albus]|uniref:Uncharacterized protein n=1 Tax=Litoribrevibacter albus TaxID=1473156 RepID=A0AA37SB11_9GAMM|nr:hypothetical protein [Litoribrevibacter albus]GLQ32670.1 hypothetical protein GCM10007876_31490 [Litoribrevibacter albus]
MAKQHGHTDITREGQLFICRPQGGFNMEGAQEYELAFAKEVVKIQDRPWAIMEVLQRFEAASPEVMKRIGAQFTWCAQNNCRWLAVVNESPLMAHLVQQYLGDSGLELQIFTEEEEALRWLRQCLQDDPQVQQITG